MPEVNVVVLKELFKVGLIVILLSLMMNRQSMWLS